MIKIYGEEERNLSALERKFKIVFSLEQIKMIKATNNAIGLEVSKEGGRIRFVAHFSQDITMTRTIPAIVLWRVWFAPESKSFAEEVLYYSEHMEIIEELPQLCRLVSEGKVEVRTQYITRYANIPPIIMYTENNETINIQLCTDKASVFLGPATEGRPDLIVVAKDELVNVLKGLLQ